MEESDSDLGGGESSRGVRMHTYDHRHTGDTVGSVLDHHSKGNIFNLKAPAALAPNKRVSLSLKL